MDARFVWIIIACLFGERRCSRPEVSGRLGGGRRLHGCVSTTHVRRYAPMSATQELIGMNLKRAPRTHAGRLELLDALMDSYLHWRDECRAVAESYRNWRSAPRLARDVAFGEYLAALDREEHAACSYRRVVARAQVTQRYARHIVTRDSKGLDQMCICFERGTAIRVNPGQELARRDSAPARRTTRLSAPCHAGMSLAGDGRGVRHAAILL